jgi:hypothetical protein
MKPSNVKMPEFVHIGFALGTVFAAEKEFQND